MIYFRHLLRHSFHLHFSPLFPSQERISQGNVQESFLSFDAATGAGATDITDITDVVADTSQDNLANLSVLEALARAEEDSMAADRSVERNLSVSESQVPRENGNSGLERVPWAHELDVEEDAVPELNESDLAEDDIYDHGDGDGDGQADAMTDTPIEETGLADSVLDHSADASDDGALESILAVEQLRQAHAAREEAAVVELERRLARERADREAREQAEREEREREKAERAAREEAERRERESERDRKSGV